MEKKSGVIVVVVVLAAVVAGFLWLFPEQLPDQGPLAPTEAVPVGHAAAPAAEEPDAEPEPAEPAILNPLESEPTAEPLPQLDESEASILKALTGALDKSWMDVLITESLIRKIVATVDHLPEATIPANVVPLKRVSGAFLVEQAGEQKNDQPAQRRALFSLRRTYPARRRQEAGLGLSPVLPAVPARVCGNRQTGQLFQRPTGPGHRRPAGRTGG